MSSLFFSPYNHSQSGINFPCLTQIGVVQRLLSKNNTRELPGLFAEDSPFLSKSSQCNLHTTCSQKESRFPILILFHSNSSSKNLQKWIVFMGSFTLEGARTKNTEDTYLQLREDFHFCDICKILLSARKSFNCKISAEFYTTSSEDI